VTPLHQQNLKSGPSPKCFVFDGELLFFFLVIPVRQGKHGADGRDPWINCFISSFGILDVLLVERRGSRGLAKCKNFSRASYDGLKMPTIKMNVTVEGYYTQGRTFFISLYVDLLEFRRPSELRKAHVTRRISMLPRFLFRSWALDHNPRR
jgi:hypothetical protein